MQDYTSIISGTLWKKIFLYMGVPEILCLSQTCKGLSRLALEKTLWLAVLHRDVLSQKMIVPTSCKTVETLEGPDIKALVLHALRLNMHMTRKRPPATTIPLHQPRSVAWVKIIRGRWLLAASFHSTQSVLSLWSVESLLSGGPPSPVAEVFLESPVNHGIVEIQDGQVVIALELRGTISCIDILTLKHLDESIVFVKLGRLHGASNLRTLHGNLVGYALHEERSIASIANWRTGAVHHLLHVPEITGGCLGMAIDGDLAVIVTPVHVQVFCLSDISGNLASELKTKLKIRHPVGFVDVSFSVPDAFIPTTQETPSLRLFISERAGLRAFVIPKNELLVQGNDLAAFLVWQSSADDRHYDSEQHALNLNRPPMDDSCPRFGTDCTTVSWIEAPCAFASSKYPTNLVTLNARLLRRNVLHDAIDPYYKIDGMKEVAFYAMASRDYDDGLGLLAVGNAFGELALYSLLPSEDLASLYSALEDVPIPVYQPHEDALPTLAPVWPRQVTHPYLAPEWIAPEDGDAPEEWQAYRPSTIPQGWSANWSKCLLVWTEFMDNAWTFAWRLERSYHYLGTVAPLLFGEEIDVVLFRCGGLSFLYYTSEEDLFVIDHPLSLDDILAQIKPPENGALETNLPVVKVPYETTAGKPPSRFYGLWAQERQVYGRDRWREFEARGGDLRDSWWTKETDVFSDDMNILI